MEQVLKILNDFWLEFSQFIPKLFFALIILFIGWIIANILARITRKILKAVQVDKLMDKIQEVDMFAGINTTISAIVGKLVYWFTFITFLIMSTQILGVEPLTKGLGSIMAYLPKVITAIIFFVIGVIVANLIKNIIQAAMSSMDLAAGRFIAGFIFYFLVVLIAITSLNQAGLDTDIITDNIKILIAGILLAFAIGYGLSSKDVMSNLLGSFYSKNKFSIGQSIRFKDHRGKIVSIDNTSITLELEPGRKLIIPQSKITNEEIEVFS